MTGAADRPAARRTLAVVIRVGALLLSSGAATDEVERAMRSIARASGLTNVLAIVQFGTISVSYDPGPDAEPITLIRLARPRTNYARLTAASELARRLANSRMTVDEALDEIERIEATGEPYPAWVSWLAAAISAAGATVLFGGGAPEAGAAGLATFVARPALDWLTRSGLPTFFRNVAGPAIAVVIVLALVLLGIPALAPVAVTGAIVIFLPGAALTAGMRDLIDGSIVSGTARLFEALLLGAAVGIGANLGLQAADIFGPQVEFGLPPLEGFAIAVQAAAALAACAAFGVQSGVPLRFMLSIGLVGAAGLVVERGALLSGMDAVLATATAAVVIGAAGRWRARAFRTSATIWIGAATLPLLPGRLLVEGLISSQSGDITQLVGAILVGFAIGIGCAFGDVVISTITEINDAIVQPVVVNPAAGLVEGWIAQATRAERRAGGAWFGKRLGRGAATDSSGEVDEVPSGDP
ncbi:MAG TPA: threonine/serine exporter family protein [Candidatus Limnocylindria bacterium]|nr:threonine/serine exporter family protein [Candidatus Limnocylindria bacterium]